MRKIEEMYTDHSDNPGIMQVTEVFCDKCDAYLGFDDDCEMHSMKVDGKWLDLCDKCYAEANGYDESLTVENAIKFGGDFKYSLNMFFLKIYTDSEINQILENDFRKLPKEVQTECIDEFASEDIREWAEKIMELDMDYDSLG